MHPSRNRNLSSNHFRRDCPSVGRMLPPSDLSFLLTKFKNYSSDEYSTVDDDGMSVPPLACAFAKMPQHQHILSVVDEDGYLILYNTHKTARHAIIKTWQIHTNAVFDLEWLQGEDRILSGSGDQTIVLHDVPTGQKLETFRGHASSIKSISCRVGDDAVFCSGSRDGHIMTWDKRIYHKDGVVPPVNTISHAHRLLRATSSVRSRKQSPVTVVGNAQQSVTCVLFQNENYLISAGAVDGCLKVWDIRKTYRAGTGATPVHVFHYPGSNTRKRGYSSLVKDMYGLRLFASCTDDKIYEYNIHNYSDKPVQCWSGHKNSTFYVKSALSPDNEYLLSGSSDDMAYIWQVNKPKASPIVLKGHTAEVTSVAWCPNDVTKLVTLSDDAKTKFWRVFCRELDKERLPPWVGRARRFSKERGTSTSADLPPVPATSQDLSVSEKIKPQNNLSSPKLVKSPSLLGWLKRKSLSAASSSTDGASPCKVQKLESSASQNSNNDTSSSGGGEKRSLKGEEPERCSGSSSSLVFDGPVTPVKRTKLEPDASCVSDPSGLLAGDGSKRLSVVSENDSSSKSPPSTPSMLPPLKIQILKSPTKSPAKSPPSKRWRGEGMISENIPSLSPKKIPKFSNEISSPKRPCLTRLESNGQNKAVHPSCVRGSLFDDDKPSSESHTGEIVKGEKLTCDSSDKSVTSQSVSGGHAPEVPVVTTPSRLSCEDFVESDSPTHNLPNLVMDELAGRNPTTPRRSSSSLTPRRDDWLTRLRLAKQKSSPELGQSPEEKGKRILGKSSPKTIKGMKKIQSYFKNKDTQ
ncbi:denticleless protein homolog [Aplysia californica]|uniref:Denticleless protein homolog n=1 Tax=Aplysia californica TaxID=6500 RepID=A0ABM0ZVB3_APLCA|nr:denticleless protein homolog [Aplysia californica]